MSGKRNKAIRAQAKELATTQKGYISKTTVKTITDPMGNVMPVQVKQTRLVDNCAKALVKMIKADRKTPSEQETAYLIENLGYVAE